MPLQLIYTSSRIGLDVGRSGFCTVAKTRGMKKNLSHALEELSYFDTEAKLAPTIFSFRTVLLATGNWFVCSRISGCGFDYTGRTNFIAHHVAFSASEISMYANPASFILNWDGWISSWNKAPEELDEADFKTFSDCKLSGSLWEKFTGMRGAVQILLKGSKFVFSSVESDTFLKLLDESFRLDARRAWDCNFTTHLQQNETPAKFNVILDNGYPQRQIPSAVRINFSALDQSVLKTLLDSKLEKRVGDFVSGKSSGVAGANAQTYSARKMFSENMSGRNSKAAQKDDIFIESGGILAGRGFYLILASVVLSAIIFVFAAVWLALSADEFISDGVVENSLKPEVQMPSVKIDVDAKPVESKNSYATKEVAKQSQDTSLSLERDKKIEEKPTEIVADNQYELKKAAELKKVAEAKKAVEAKKNREAKNAAERLASIFPDLKRSDFGSPQCLVVVRFPDNSQPRYLLKKIKEILLSDDAFRVCIEKMKPASGVQYKFFKWEASTAKIPFAVLSVFDNSKIPVSVNADDISEDSEKDGFLSVSDNFKNKLKQSIFFDNEAKWEIIFEFLNEANDLGAGKFYNGGKINWKKIVEIFKELNELNDKRVECENVKSFAKSEMEKRNKVLPFDEKEFGEQINKKISELFDKVNFSMDYLKMPQLKSKKGRDVHLEMLGYMYKAVFEDMKKTHKNLNFVKSYNVDTPNFEGLTNAFRELYVRYKLASYIEILKSDKGVANSGKLKKYFKLSVEEAEGYLIELEQKIKKQDNSPSDRNAGKNFSMPDYTKSSIISGLFFEKHKVSETDENGDSKNRSIFVYKEIIKMFSEFEKYKVAADKYDDISAKLIKLDSEIAEKAGKLNVYKVKLPKLEKGNDVKSWLLSNRLKSFIKFDYN